MVFKPRQKRQVVDFVLQISNLRIGWIRVMLSLGDISDEYIVETTQYPRRP